MSTIPAGLDFALGEAADTIRDVASGFAARRIAPLAAQIDEIRRARWRGPCGPGGPLWVVRCGGGIASCAWPWSGVRGRVSVVEVGRARVRSPPRGGRAGP